MREINLIVIHCSATPQGLDIGVKQIDAMHRARGFAMIGYHYVIRENGRREGGRAIDRPGAHVSGHNAKSIGVCLIGGLDHNRKPANTFTPQQFAELEVLLRELKSKFPKARIVGHRDLSPDLDGDGVIERHEWVKECPCFDVAEWLAERDIKFME